MTWEKHPGKNINKTLGGVEQISRYIYWAAYKTIKFESTLTEPKKKFCLKKRSITIWNLPILSVGVFLEGNRKNAKNRKKNDYGKNEKKNKIFW